jgi:hypothetical protein
MESILLDVMLCTCAMVGTHVGTQIGPQPIADKGLPRLSTHVFRRLQTVQTRCFLAPGMQAHATHSTPRASP